MRREKEEILQMYEDYLKCSSLKEVDLKYKTDCLYYFKKYDLPRKKLGISNSLRRKNCFDLNFNFKEITNEWEAYILGFIYADGWVSHNQIGLRLQKKDKDILEKIKNYFSEDIKLQESKTSYVFVISSQVACDNALALGVENNKTEKEFHFPQIPEVLYKDFIRGYFDGDGSVFVCNKKFLKCNICSPTITILQDIQKILSENNIESKINTEKRKGKFMKIPSSPNLAMANFDMHRLFIRKKEEIEKLFTFLYKDATIFMDRKKDVFVDNYEMLKKLR